MLTLPYLRENTTDAIERLQKRSNLDASPTIHAIIELDTKRREKITLVENKQAAMNVISKEIGKLMQTGQIEQATAAKSETSQLKADIVDLETELNILEIQLQELVVSLPNTPHSSIKTGCGADDNDNVHEEGEIPTLFEGALCHWDIASKYDIIDFELGVKVTGAGFPFYKGKGARLQRALINFFLDKAIEAGYYEIQPPILINGASGFGTGQLPDKEGQMYYSPVDDLYLIPTAEVPITNMFRDEIIALKDLPKKYCGYTPCFRREAGSYGKDVRGLNRLHQFDKVEIVQVTTPENSYSLLEEMKNHVASLLRELKLPFRILKLCGGDMGFSSACTYDFEVYSAAQKRWLEVSSVSNFETFQSNRLKLRYKDEQGKTSLAHTLNGSALALPRIVAALLENHQQADGIRMPAAIAAYTKFDILN